ncbi:DNA mismatch repair MSH3 [Micractinium conductrix]|uniref:DNA mismatch repair protein n=1 Tax=Micractinium conductrix TaxID=554055 RepID=A0A2P6VI08_9CHLO|nr:DNA mismatch repair MSH3 [Micractinium conductrix]|eukprot:PSC73725.1 DNA mismatch repair MSH3 [Micractinium conductrix]
MPPKPFFRRKSAATSGGGCDVASGSTAKPKAAPKGKKGTPSKGQRAITNFLVPGFTPGGSRPLSTTAATAAATASDGPGGSPPRAAKRPRLAGDEHQEAGSPAEAAAAATEPQRSRSPPAAAQPGAPRVPVAGAPRPGDVRRALQHKLGVAEPPSPGGGAAAAGSSAAAAVAAVAAGARQALIEPPFVSDPSLPIALAERSKLTPLELQVVELKRAHPGVLLCVEVGYKFKFYGADAEAASRVLGIYAFQDRVFLCATFPTYRLRYHVRRLVHAGHKVGVVRQVETAAIKSAAIKAGDVKSKQPFERKLTALYTRATLEAGELGGLSDDDCGDDEEQQQGGGAAENGAAGAAAGAAAAVARRRRRRRQGAPPQPASYLVCCVEEPAGGGAGGSPGGTGSAAASQQQRGVEVALVAVEPSTGAVLHTQFRDGLIRQELESRLLFATPAELLLGEPLSPETRRLCEHIGEQLGAAPRLETVQAGQYGRSGAAALTSLLEFYGAPLSGGGEGGGAGGDEAPADGASGSRAGGSAAAAGASGQQQLAAAASPAALAALRALPPLVLRALALLVDHLRPFGLEGVLRLGASFQRWEAVQEMRLSANTLRQLQIFSNSLDGGKKGSLLGVMDQTQTAFGRRLMRSWVGKPLRQREAIEARLDAVAELAEQGGSHPVLSRLHGTLRQLGDLERGITRAFHGTTRPADFAALLQTFARLREQLGMPSGAAGAAAHAVVTGAAEAEECADAAAAAGGSADGAPADPSLRGLRSALLRQLFGAAAEPAVAAAARQLLDCMNLEEAAKNDPTTALKDSQRFPEVLRRRRGYGAAQAHLDGLLAGFRRQLQIGNLQFVTLQNQGEYLVEVPPELAGRVPKDWKKVSSVKKAVRFHPPEVLQGLEALELAREHLQAASRAAWRRFLADFAAQYLPFRASVQALAALDCLAGLAALASSPGYTRPALLPPGTPPQLHVQAGRHPVLELLLEARGEQFVPNDTHLQSEGQRCAIITGPNMGGKSCYTRQCALIAIMAQVGSFVPAAAVRLTPLDGIYSRMGAADNLALGRSTFAEELCETSAILQGATDHSLVILDELGRGTSTGDGAAIAEATLAHVVAGQGAPHPLTFFITHYPEVCFRLQQAHPEAVGCYRMAHVEEEEQGGGAAGPAATAQQAQQPVGAEFGRPAQAQAQAQQQEQQAAAAAAELQQQLPHQHRITFLYRLTEGIAPASYGLNVARLAELPPAVVARAGEVAAQQQAAAEQRRAARQAAAAAAACSSGAPASAGAGGELSAAAQQCREFLAAALARGSLDAEAGRRLQARARELLGACGTVGS